MALLPAHSSSRCYKSPLHVIRRHDIDMHQLTSSQCPPGCTNGVHLELLSGQKVPL